MSSHTLPLRVLALAGASVAAVAIARLVRRRRAGADAQPREAVRDARCECGQEFRVAGAGRHAVFWVAGAPEDDPVLGDACPRCGRGLPVAA